VIAWKMITREGSSYPGAATMPRFDSKLESRDLAFKDWGIAEDNALTRIDLREFRVQHHLKGAKGYPFRSRGYYL
jgi:hypothetical protein